MQTFLLILITAMPNGTHHTDILDHGLSVTDCYSAALPLSYPYATYCEPELQKNALFSIRGLAS